VNCLVWHPESTATDKWISPFSNYLAVASDSKSIIIFDMSELIKELERMKDLSEEEKDEINSQNKQEDHKLYKIVTTLEGHSQKVVCLAWSSHVSGLLVSGSYDNVAQVRYIYITYITRNYPNDRLHDRFVLTYFHEFIRNRYLLRNIILYYTFSLLRV